MNKNINDLLHRQEEIVASMATANEEQFRSLESEYNANRREIELLNQRSIAEANAPKATKSANAQFREVINAVRRHELDGDFQLRDDSQATITSSVISSGDKNNMTSAGIPLNIQQLINPMELPTIYQALGMKIATGVRGQIQWPFLTNAVEVTVGGELDDISATALDFSKVTATPYKLGISIEVSNEAINDEAFDLIGTVTAQMQKAVGRTLDKRVLNCGTTLFSAKNEFIGPLMKKNAGGTAYEAKAQSYSFTGSSNTTDFTTKEPTYKDLKKMKGKVLASGADMAGFCFCMPAAVYSFLEGQSKDTGSGRFIIENGKIDGDPVYISNNIAAKTIVCGCWAYEALNQHGPVHFVVDPYTKAKKGVTIFTLVADWSMTELVDSAATQPFVIGA